MTSYLGATDPLPDSGTLLINTFSGSSYELNLDRMELRRIPALNPTTVERELVFRVGELSVEQADLRRDREWVKVLLVRLELDRPAVFILEPLGDQATSNSTRRITSDVTSIGHLS